MPLPPHTESASQDAHHEPDLDPELNPDSDPETEPDSNQATPWYATPLGVMTHSFIYWPQGKSEDTVHLNPCFKRTTEPHNNDIEYSIYCIHGTADGSYAFKKLVDRLLENQPKKSHNWLPQSISKIHLLAFQGELYGVSCMAYAEQLASKIIKNGDKHVILFGHSRGSLIGAKFTTDLAEKYAIIVHGVFAFCGPFGGSPWALPPFTTLSSSIAEMQPNSQFLQDLRASITRTEEESQKYFYFVAEQDSLVSAESAVIDDHSPAVTLMPNHGHLSILTSQKILKPIHHYLKTITNRPVVQQPPEQPIKTVCLELEAEIIALKYRTHMYSNTPKLNILNALKTGLSEISKGNQSKFFLEVRTIGEFIHEYMQTIHPGSKRSFYDIIKQNLNPSVFSFWKIPPSKSQICIDNLILQYRDVPLPTTHVPRLEPSTN